jgi:hypothetical protein
MFICSPPHPAQAPIRAGFERILKRRGTLTAMDVEQVVSEASASLAGVRKRSGWW